MFNVNGAQNNIDSEAENSQQPMCGCVCVWLCVCVPECVCVVCVSVCLCVL
jgi:hypothetical protein